MLDLLTQPQIIAFICLSLTLLALIRTKLRSPSGLPPGPPGHWLFGNTIPEAL